MPSNSRSIAARTQRTESAMTTRPDQVRTLLDSKRYALLAAGFVIALAAAYNWVIAPHLGYLHAMERLEPAVNTMAGELGRISDTLDERWSRLRRLRRELAESRMQCFTAEECRRFMQALQDRVEEAGCLTVAVDFTRDDPPTADARPSAPVQACHVDLTVVGKYEQMIMLFQELREGQEKIGVDSYRLDLLDSTRRQMELQIRLAIHAVLPPDEVQRVRQEAREVEP